MVVVVVVCNDHPDHNVGQVIAALNGAVDEWDRIHLVLVAVVKGPHHYLPRTSSARFRMIWLRPCS